MELLRSPSLRLELASVAEAPAAGGPDENFLIGSSY